MKKNINKYRNKFIKLHYWDRGDKKNWGYITGDCVTDVYIHEDDIPKHLKSICGSCYNLCSKNGKNPTRCMGVFILELKYFTKTHIDYRDDGTQISVGVDPEIIKRGGFPSNVVHEMYDPNAKHNCRYDKCINLILDDRFLWVDHIEIFEVSK